MGFSFTRELFAVVWLAISFLSIPSFVSGSIMGLLLLSYLIPTPPVSLRIQHNFPSVMSARVYYVLSFGDETRRGIIDTAHLTALQTAVLNNNSHLLTGIDVTALIVYSLKSKKECSGFPSSVTSIYCLTMKRSGHLNLQEEKMADSVLAS
eukprot:TRINITY_DN1382_c1_g1_i10.p2 TRINITY_DN1382_c1_g1~~TRINITY_DN1382_c1_g1_i10.p2  ORF type:complete len:151 (-),score=16.66 TRINITY_DN1382_c1_g1_i10:820-1272(-)